MFGMPFFHRLAVDWADIFAIGGSVSTAVLFFGANLRKRWNERISDCFKQVCP